MSTPDHTGANGRIDSPAELIISERGPEQAALIEVHTDVHLTKNSEMMFYIFPSEGRGNASMIRRLVPPSKPGPNSS